MGCHQSYGVFSLLFSAACKYPQIGKPGVPRAGKGMWLRKESAQILERKGSAAKRVDREISRGRVFSKSLCVT